MVVNSGIINSGVMNDRVTNTGSQAPRASDGFSRSTLLVACTLLAAWVLPGVARGEELDDASVAAEQGRRLDDRRAEPATPRKEAVDHYHGETILDPYRWLEKLDAPQTVEWLKEQDDYARTILADLAGRQAIRDRMDAIRQRESISVPQIRGQRRFYQVARAREGSAQVQVVVEERGQTRVLIDLDDFPEGSRFSTSSGSASPTFQVSPDGRFLAFGVRQQPSRWTRWRVLDIASGNPRGRMIEGIHTDATSTVWWAPDSSGFFYAAHREQAGEEDVVLRDQAIYFHDLEGSGEDRLIYREAESQRVLWLSLTHDGRYLSFKNVAGNDQDLYLLDLQDPRGIPELLLAGNGEKHALIDRVGDHLWLRTTRGADRGRIVALDPEAPEGDRQLVEIVAERPWGALIDALIVGERLLVHRVEHAIPRLELYTLDGSFERALDLPYIGWLSSGLVASREASVVAFELQGTADPGSLFLLDVESGETSPFHRPAAGFDPAPYVTRQVFYPAHDGTLVPLFLMYRRGLQLDSRRPVWLYAYGSNWSAAPWYQAQHRLWLELGGVYALAHVRGGGEYGDSWIAAGSGRNKQTGIDDYVAAAEWLIKSGYSSPDFLVANGGSASGPLVAAAVNQRPELFRVALIDYPLIDMLRAPLFLSTNIGNFDTPEEPDAFRALRAWSPYQNVRNGACYPATLIAHGDQDRLAVPSHSYKFVAALQAAQSCGRPVLLQVAWGHGHTVGGVEERANQVAFVVGELGLSVPSSW